MATNPVGINKTNLSISVTKDFHATLLALAEESGMRLGEYCRRILEEAVNVPEPTVYRIVKSAQRTELQQVDDIAAKLAAKAVKDLDEEQTAGRNRIEKRLQ
jgi:predicted transcriptional regulator